MKFRLSYALPVVLVAAALAGCGGGGDDSSSDTGSSAPPAATQEQSGGGATTPAESGGGGADGARIFASAGCEGCHTLAAAGSTGNVGPNLDDLKPSFDTVRAQVTNGGGGMPAFGGDLSPEEIDAVARYVSDNAGK